MVCGFLLEIFFRFINAPFLRYNTCIVSFHRSTMMNRKTMISFLSYCLVFLLFSCSSLFQAVAEA